MNNLTRERAFSTYTSRLYQILRHKKYDLQQAKTEDERKALGSKYYEIAYNVFTLYKDITSYNFKDEIWKLNDCFREITEEDKKKYICHLNNEDNTFELVRVLEYRGVEFPEFLDDYGMDTFIEVVDPKTNIYLTFTTQFDWDFALDELFDVNWLFDQEDIDIKSIDSKLDFITNNNFYKNL